MELRQNSDLIISKKVPAMAAIKAGIAVHELGHLLGHYLVAQGSGVSLQSYRIEKGDGYLHPTSALDLLALAPIDHQIMAVTGPAMQMLFKAELLGATDSIELNWREEHPANLVSHAFIACGSVGDLAQFITNGGFRRGVIQALVLACGIGESLATQPEVILALASLAERIEAEGAVDIKPDELLAILGLPDGFKVAA
jgi:hypothetical protein